MMIRLLDLGHKLFKMAIAQGIIQRAPWNEMSFEHKMIWAKVACSKRRGLDG